MFSKKKKKDNRLNTILLGKTSLRQYLSLSPSVYISSSTSTPLSRYFLEEMIIEFDNDVHY